MKILLIMPLDHKYGSPHSLRIFLEKMRQVAPETEIVVITGSKGGINDYCNEIGVENYVVNHEYATYAPMKSKILEKTKRFLKIIRVKIGYLVAIYRIERKVAIDSFDLIYCGINRDVLGILLAKKYKKPLVIHLQEFSKAHFGILPLFKNQIKLMNQYATQFIAISKAVAKDWKLFGLESSKIKVVYNGLIPEEVSITNYDNKSRYLRVVMIGGIYKQKGQVQLIKAATLLGNKYKEKIKIDFYGEGKKKYLQDLKEIVKTGNVEGNISFKGYDSTVSMKLKNYDVGVLCSKAEGFGLVTAEYMMAGLCPIVSDTGANKELVDNNVTGLIYCYDDVYDLAKKIEYLMDHPDRRMEMGKAARNVALNKFNADNYVHGIYDVFYKVILENASQSKYV